MPRFYGGPFRSIPITLGAHVSRRRSLRGSMVLALALWWAFGLVASGSTDLFVDDNESIHESSIEYIAALGVTRGCNPPTNDRFCPQDPVTRGQMAAFLTRALDLSASSQTSFKDSQGQFQREIQALADAGISKGCNPPANDRFCPTSMVTRAQMASFLVRAFDLPPAQEDRFSDDKASVHEAAINALAKAGVTAGCSSHLYCPNEPVTRAQMASFLKRALTGEGVGDPEGPPPPPTTDLPGTDRPNGAVSVEPDDDLATVADRHPSGTTFFLEAGVHRHASVIPQDGDQFVGARGAVMSGARLLTSFQKEGNLWYASGQSQQGEVGGQCQDGYSACVYPEQLFKDDVALWQVTSKTALKAGSWYFDYENNRIYLAENPTGHRIETSITPYAFAGNAKKVLISNLVIEKYASPTQKGAIEARAAKNWTVEESWVQSNHGSGIRVGSGLTIRQSLVYANGQIGINGQGDGLVIQSTEIAHNQIGGFKAFGWVGGGVKINKSADVRIRGNHVHHNNGHGLHTDGGSRRVLYEYNTVTDNAGVGISHEISYEATIRSNDVRRNGFGRSIGLGGSGIYVNSSSNVEVSKNVVADNADGIGGQQSNREGHTLENLWVHDNVIHMSTGNTGVVTATDDSVFSRNNRFDRNEYHLTESGGNYFRWAGSQLNFSEWQDAGQDGGGSAISK